MNFCPDCKKLLSPMRPKPKEEDSTEATGKLAALPPAAPGRLFCQNRGCLRVMDQAQESRFIGSVATGRARVVLEEKVEARPLQNVLCPKCGHGRAYFHLMQTRRSDEPPTQINQCEKCGHSWRDYG